MPKFWSRQGVSLEEAIEAVGFWLRTHDTGEAEAWLERAADELDLQERTAGILEAERALLELSRPSGGETTPEPEPTNASAARALAVSGREEERHRQREVSRGEEAFLLGDYEKALEHFRPLAKEGDPSAYFYLGRMSEKGAGVPQNYVKAYALVDLAADEETTYPANEAQQRIAKLMSAEELKEARRITS